MSKSVQLIKDHDVKWIDLRFTDTKGTQHHVTMPARDALDEDFFEVGKMFDGLFVLRPSSFRFAAPTSIAEYRQ